MTITSRTITLALTALMLGIAVPALAQTEKPKGEKADAPAAAQPAPATKKPDLPAPPPNFEYTAGGRRDPFVSLANRGNDGKNGGAAVKRGEGLAGMLTSEMTVRGILFTRGAHVAMVSGPDGKVYTVRAGDKVADGVVRSVTADAVVILQEVNDPLSLEKQREVRKFLRSGEEVK
jgi:Tfp pilus assembly protein PilP